MFDLPLEYALIEFEDAKLSGKIIPELLHLAERGIVRFVDIAFIQKEEDGTTRTLELNDLDPEVYELFVPVGEHVSNLFTNDDLQIAASRLPAKSAAVLFLWENLWVADLARRHGRRRSSCRTGADRPRDSRRIQGGSRRGIAGDSES